MLDGRDGATVVRLARHAVEALFDPGRGEPEAASLPAVFHERRGAFVTWKHYPEGRLRGCIGYALPVLPLREAVRRAAVAAAIDDPRFPPVLPEELDRLAAEVSVLGVPSLLGPTGRELEVLPGRDGVIVETDQTSGLLLPQVAVEQDWTAVELLDGTCEKAGLPRGAWRRPSVRVRTFRAEVWGETSPRGAVSCRSGGAEAPSSGSAPT